MRCVLYRADVKLRACSGRERPEQPKSKLFAKLAVKLFVLNLIRAFVGVCGHVVSELRVCGVFAMQDHSHAWFGVLLLVVGHYGEPEHMSKQLHHRHWQRASAEQQLVPSGAFLEAHAKLWTLAEHCLRPAWHERPTLLKIVPRVEDLDPTLV